MEDQTNGYIYESPNLLPRVRPGHQHRRLRGAAGDARGPEPGRQLLLRGPMKNLSRANTSPSPSSWGLRPGSGWRPAPGCRNGDFTESGRGPWECSPDADCLRLVRRYVDQLLLVDEEEKARLTTLILGHRLRRTYFTPLSTFPWSGPGRR